MDHPHGWLSLVPPLVAIVVAIATKRVIGPLLIGVLAGAVLVERNAGASVPLAMAIRFFEFLWESVKDKDHLYAFAFSMLLAAMVGVLEHCGGMRDLVARLSRRIRTRAGAQRMMFGSGLALFFDDYANTLLIGGTMRGAADRYGVSREKLAYLVDSTAAPVAGLAVISTWSAIEISYMQEGLVEAGVTDPAAPLWLFLRSIPHRFYCWLALAFIAVNVFSGRDWGPMLRAEQAARPRPPADVAETSINTRFPLWIAAIVPVLVCVAVVLFFLVRTGLASEDLPPLDGMVWWQKAGTIMGNGNSFVALTYGGGLGWLTAIILHAIGGRTDAATLAWSSVRGAWQMLPAMFILWLAWAIASVTGKDMLDTGGYLSAMLNNQLDPRLLPTLVFALAGGVAFATGTSWGTMGILTPLSVNLAIRMTQPAMNAGAGLDLDLAATEMAADWQSWIGHPIVLSTSGAVLAGAILGDHCSPISDTTVLSSRSSGCDHVAHVRTQMPYALSVAGVSIALGTIPAALGVSAWLCLFLGILAVIGLLYGLGRRPGAAGDPADAGDSGDANDVRSRDHSSAFEGDAPVTPSAE